MSGKLGQHIQTDDWKNEKHVPVIECPNTVKANEMFDVRVSIGKEVSHPNTTEHHIRWISVYFHPDGDKFNYEVGHFEFNAHGESVQGPDQGPVYTHHGVTTTFKTLKSGTIHALAYCNIHGLWENSVDITAG